MPSYYGKYRAYVVKTDDPEKRGRVKVECPKVLGDSRSAWCEPCLANSFDGDGDFCLPKTGDTVWVEFEDGDVNKPIWVGNWWSEEKTPMPDYDKAGETRIISFKGVKFTMTEEKLVITVGNSNIEMTSESIRLNTPNFYFDGGVDVSGEMTVTGNTSITGNTNIRGETDIEGGVIMKGDTKITQNLEVENDVNIGGDTNLKQNLNVGGNTSVEGSTTLKDTLNIAGKTTAQDDVDITGTLKVGTINMNTHTHLIPDDPGDITDVPKN